MAFYETVALQNSYQKIIDSDIGWMEGHENKVIVEKVTP